MTERPILFSGEMVMAILSGRKCQTRRVVKPQIAISRCSSECACGGPPEFVWEQHRGASFDSLAKFCPYGVPGDRLWVRETLGVVENWGTIHYVADNAVCYDPEHQKAGFPFTA